MSKTALCQVNMRRTPFVDIVSPKGGQITFDRYVDNDGLSEAQIMARRSIMDKIRTPEVYISWLCELTIEEMEVALLLSKKISWP